MTELLSFVRAVINSIDGSSGLPQKIGHSLMHLLQIRHCHKPFRYAALIGNNDNVKTGSVQLSNAFDNAWKDMEIFPAGHVIALWWFSVYNAVTIQEHCFSHRASPLLMQPRISYLIELAKECLGPRVIFGCPDVDEHSVLLKRIHPTFE